VPLPVVADLPRVEHADIVMDGRLDDAAWDDALAFEDFRTFQPVPLAEPVGTAVARLLVDDDALYVSFSVTDPQPQRVRATLARRDSSFDDDFVGLYLDLGGEGQRAYVFIVNPLGIQMDGVATASGNEDFSWDTQWRSAGGRTDDGYDVELAIPWRSIRHQDDVDRTGVFLFRQRADTGEKSSAPPIDPDVQGLLVQQAILGGPGPLPRSLGLELAPSLSFSWTDQGPDDSLWNVGGVSPGITVQWSPTPADTLLLTLNPDFSQVENDAFQIDVNRRYALSYAEQRPFFLEGQEWFGSAFDGLLYTRSMVAPRTGVRATVARDGWAVAALNVWDAHPSPSVSEGGGWTEADVDGHAALETIGRARAPVGQDGYVGVIFSDRTLPGTGLANRVGMADTRLRLSDGWVVEGAGGGSTTSMSDGSTLAGPAGALSVDYSSEHFWLDTEAQLISPEFRAENGFLTRSDSVGSWVESGYRSYPDGKLVRMIQFLPMDMYAYWQLDGRMREFVFEPDVWASFGNGTGVFVEYQYNNELYQDDWFTFHRWEGGGGGAFTNWLSAWLFAGGGQGILYDEVDPHLGLRHWVSLSNAVQPVHWLSLSGALSWERFDEFAGGGKVYDGWTGRLRAEAFASRTLSMWALLDHNSFSDATRAQGMVVWEHAPGQAFYLGGGSDIGADPAQGVFAKIDWVFTL